MSGKNNVEKLSEIDNHVGKHYNIIRRLGKGAYGIVWEAINKKSKRTVAVKKIFDAFRNQTDAQRTFREIMFLLSFANHENIIRLIGLHKANNNQDIYLIFEFMETDLHKVIKKGNILKDIHKIFIMYQLFKATKYIHSGNVIHRDLKPSNILLNSQCHCKIADFGLARSVSQRLNNRDSVGGVDPTLTDYVATRWYRAPEILIASKKYTKGIDMWSLGCILGEMLLEKPLFPGSSTINQVERIMATLPPPSAEDIASVSAGYGSILLEKTPVPRRNLRELLVNVHESALNLIGRLIVFNPNRRLTAIEALEHPYVANFHYRAYEPERGSNVIPPLRDDVQLSVEEYRNKLYAMMDEKPRSCKNLLKYKLPSKSKSRVRRITEQIGKKESNIIQAGQGDTVKKKDLHISNNDIRKEKEIKDYSKQQPPQVNGKSVIVQYAQNLIKKNSRNIPPNQAKSCQCLMSHQQPQQQQELTKTQRSIKTDQLTRPGINSKSNIVMNQPKVRKLVKTSKVNKCTTGSTLNSSNHHHHHHYPLLKISNPILSKSTNKYNDKTPSITKHFAYSDQDVYNNSTQSQSQVIQDYLNQMIPRPQRIPNESKKSTTEYTRNSRPLHKSSQTINCKNINNRLHDNNVARRNSINKQQNSTTVKDVRYIGNYYQNYSITASPLINSCKKYR